ncbi:histidine kinase [Brachybacterium rhamnosum]|uniref:histidine kinase n=1 Tax=Brachybacterium rhamnosum TaxID=173361 RepID=A0ABW4PTF2_9MICO
MSSLRRLGRRTAWLMAGAAIGLAVVLLVAALAVLLVGIVAGPRAVLGTPTPAAFALCAIAAVLIGALLGLVPGVRELEVTGARAMLGARGELIVPEAPRAGHRVRTVAFVVLHQLLGLAVVSLLGMVLPGGVAALVEAVTGSATGVGPALPLDGGGRALRVPLGLAEVALGLGGAWPLGLLAAALAPPLLGPTPADRLAAAQARADREEEHRRIARDLHDGIGHALTAIGIQAAAARRVGADDPALVAGALEAVESTAREATAELDAVLAVLREEREAPPPTSPPPARSLDALLDRHRRAGMELRAQVDLPADVAPLVSRHLERILAELLANAARHGGTGPVDVHIGHSDAELRIEVTNPLPHSRPSPPGRRSGHGLDGLRERAGLLGGSLEAGPVDGRGAPAWRAVSRLPLLTRPEHRSSS